VSKSKKIPKEAIELVLRLIRSSISCALKAMELKIYALAEHELERTLVDLRYLEELISEGEKCEEVMREYIETKEELEEVKE